MTDHTEVKPGEHTGRLWCWLAHKTYSIGLSSGGCHSWLSDGTPVTRINWRGKRCYFLGWERQKWRCVLKFHHWPRDWPVAFGLCGRCVPWSCCGSTWRDHAADCTELVA
jgi:hypothetical protein